MLSLFALAAAAQVAAPTGLHGAVHGAGIPLPGATVTAAQGSTTLVQTTGPDGRYAFPKAAAGRWTVSVGMTGFVPASRTVTAPAEADFQLRIAALPVGAPTAATPMPPAQPGRPGNRGGALVVRGSEDNAAASQHAQRIAFGNARPARGSIYNGNLTLTLDSSAFDARSVSLTGEPEPRPHFGDTTASFQIGGPLPIPGIWGSPEFFLAYTRSRASSYANTPALVPTLTERSQATSPQAAALLPLYPLPNLPSGGQYNYQTNVPASTHTDGLQSRLDSTAGSDILFGHFNLQSARADQSNIFAFDDHSATLNLTSELGWEHNFTPQAQGVFRFTYGRQRTRITPYFAGRTNLEGEAGIVGADASPANWGPPTLEFSSGLATLEDGLAQNNRNQTATASFDGSWYHFTQNVQFGAALNRLEFNQWQQQNPRGTFIFNGAATGTALGDFLAGRPDAASLAWGNADKYFRQWTGSLYLSDAWRRPSFTLNAGLRWDYQPPIVERYGRLVNLDLASDLASATPAVSGTGGLHALGGEWQPRIGAAWTPFPASSLVLNAGYSIYYDTSVYLSLAEQMAQQAPLSRSLDIAATTTAPLTLATGLEAAGGAGTDVFAVAPGFRPGYAQTWNTSAQITAPGGNVVTLTYNGVKGTHAVQRSYPNTFAPGARDPCPACPAGFLYETANGNSTLESGTVQLERRLHRGFAFTVAYTYANAMDDAALGGGTQQTAPVIAQNWRDLDGERARSSFDQRNLLKLNAQWSTGFGLHPNWPRWLTDSWQNWTITTQVTAGSGLPLTPTIAAVLPRTSYTGLRPDVTGASPTAAPAGQALNPAAYRLPPEGAWGDAGRNSITGPSEFLLDAAVQRAFRTLHGLSPTLKLEATNALNHVTYTGWDAVVGSSQFGLPLAAKPMRRIRAVLRFTF